MDWTTYNNLYNEGGEGYNPYPPRKQQKKQISKSETIIYKGIPKTREQLYALRAEAAHKANTLLDQFAREICAKTVEEIDVVLIRARKEA